MISFRRPSEVHLKTFLRGQELSASLVVSGIKPKRKQVRFHLLVDGQDVAVFTCTQKSNPSNIPASSTQYDVRIPIALEYANGVKRLFCVRVKVGLQTIVEKTLETRCDRGTPLRQIQPVSFEDIRQGRGRFHQKACIETLKWRPAVDSIAEPLFFQKEKSLAKAEFAEIEANSDLDCFCCLENGFAIANGPVITDTGSIIWETTQNNIQKEILFIDRAFRNKFEKLSKPVFVIQKKGANNYFHWMTEMLPKLEMLACISENEKIRPLVISHLSIGCTVESIKLFFPHLEPLVAHADWVQFPEAIVPSQKPKQSNNQSRVDHWMRVFTKRIRSQLDLSQRIGNRKLFLTRTDAKYRRCLNEGEIWDILKSDGYERIECGKMSLEDQITTFGEASHIVAIHGAALTNVIFAPSRCSVTEIIPANMLDRARVYADLCALANINYSSAIGSDGNELEDFQLPKESLIESLERGSQSEPIVNIKTNSTRHMKPSNFFIVGCVRSGTTLLRNLLKEHPQLACPEESHIYRWAWPYRTQPFRNHYEKAAIFKKHQEMDGVSSQEVKELLDSTETRAEFTSQYIERFLKANKREDCAWFEKTPQNVYGLLLARAEFPEAKFINIIRNPLNVVASLKKGVIMQEKDMVAACSYWREAVLIANQFKLAFSNQMLVLYYEELTTSPKSSLKSIYSFIGAKPTLPKEAIELVHPENNQQTTILSEEERELVRRLCDPVIKQCGIRDYFAE